MEFVKKYIHTQLRPMNYNIFSHVTMLYFLNFVRHYYFANAGHLDYMTVLLQSYCMCFWLT